MYLDVSLGLKEMKRVTIYTDDDYVAVVQRIAKKYKLGDQRTLKLMQTVRDQIGLAVVKEASRSKPTSTL